LEKVGPKNTFEKVLQNNLLLTKQVEKVL